MHPAFLTTGSVSSELYTARINMAGIRGTVDFDTGSQEISTNLTSDCAQVNVSIHELPIMYGHSESPCSPANTGGEIYRFVGNGMHSTLNYSDFFKTESSLSDLSVIIHHCQTDSRACGTVTKKSGLTKTWQGKFFISVAGEVYIRQNVNETSSRILTDLRVTNSSRHIQNVSLYLSQTCVEGAQDNATSNRVLLGEFQVGTPLNARRFRNDGVNLTTGTPEKFLVMNDNGTLHCAELRQLEAKRVSAVIGMKGVKGYLNFSQISPFDPTIFTIFLTNLNKLAKAYHVHNFPVPQQRTAKDMLCSNDNLGGHWNPFGLDTSSTSYPKFPNGTHDHYEVGDLSGRHGSLADMNEFEKTFKDWNLPLFGTNSIVGRSVVIHHPNSSRWLCGSIGYPGEVKTAVAIFTSPVAGRIMFKQLANNPYSDVTIFLELSYVNSSALVTDGHNWHVHEYPISSESDSDTSICSTTMGHFNPFKVDVKNLYKTECSPESPFRCEIGDYASKHKAINLPNRTGTVNTKSFFTDTTSALDGQRSIFPRSVVIHGKNYSSTRLACANLTLLHSVQLRTDAWMGVGKLNGNVTFKQVSNLDPTVIQTNLMDINGNAKNYFINTLPIKNGSSACSDTNVEGHYNPFSVNMSLSPAPGNGTADQYQVGDISGKFGTLSGLKQSFQQHIDTNMALFGPRSIAGRSLVIYSSNESRWQCANLIADNDAAGEWIRAKVVFNGTMNGTVTLLQLVFPDGSSSDTTVEVYLQQTRRHSSASEDLKWHIHTYPRKEDDQTCSNVGGHYNPYKIDTKAKYNSTCSLSYPLHCEVGDMNSKQGPISLGKRYLMNDVNLPLNGDFTVVGRSVVVHSNGPKGKLMNCGTIVADSPVKSLIFPTVKHFSRYDFRHTIADFLGIQVWRVTILPEGKGVLVTKGCQKVRFYTVGNVDQQKLNAIEKSKELGNYTTTDDCRSDPSGAAGSGHFPNDQTLILLILAVMMQFGLYCVLE
eukprot:gi/632970740/ref/XP_007901815.1/ PREDICTED: uncharacterized protein LOC103185229 isoform X1 [Callorhinchus milii]